MVRKLALALLVTVLASAGLASAGCERTGRKIDTAAEKTGKAVKKAGKKTGTALKKAGEKVEEKLD